MLYIDQKLTTEIKENGVEMTLIIDKTQPDESLFQNEQNLHIVESMFMNNDATHKKIVEVASAVDTCISTYDKNLVSAIFDEIVSLDQQAYADIMGMIKAVLAAMNDRAFTITANSIKHIAASENNSNETAEEAANENVETATEERFEDEAVDTKEDNK